MEHLGVIEQAEMVAQILAVVLVVVSGETRQKVGFAEKFRAAHEREAAAARRRRERRDDASRG